MRLPDLQKAFAKSVLYEPDAALLAAIDDEGSGACSRLAVYRNNVFGSLLQALKTSFPYTVKLVGEDYFRRLARGYVQQTPPQSGILDEYGFDFPDYLSTVENLQPLAYIRDFTRFEWLLGESLNARNDQSLNPQSLIAQDEATVSESCLPLRGMVRLMASRHPLDTIWRFCQAATHDSTLQLTQGPQYFLIYRHDCLDIWFERISEAEFAALKALSSRRSLFEALSSAARIERAFDPAAFLAKFFVREIFVKS
jgi:hypothetical protein